MDIKVRIVYSNGKDTVLHLENTPFRSFQDWISNFLGAKWQTYNNSAYNTERIDFIVEVR